MKRKIWLGPVVLGMLMPFALVGCMVDDDDPDYVTTPGSSTTVIKEDRDPDVHITPTPNITVTTPPPVVKDPPDVIIVDPPRTTG